MRVAIVYQYFAHYRGPVIEELSKDTEIEYFFLGGNQTHNASSSIKLHQFTNGQNFREIKNIWIGKYFLWQQNLTGELKKGKYDVIIFLSDWKYLSTWVALFHLKPKIPTLFWGHGILNKESSITNFIKFMFLKRFNAGGFLYDNRAKEILMEKGYPYPLTVIYNSLNYDTQCKVLKSITENNIKTPGLPINEPYVIFSGRVLKERRLELLFDAIKLLKENGVLLNVLIVGTGPHQNDLISYVENLSITGQVVFYGACYDEFLLGKFFINSLSLVFPGPIGLSAIHSLTYGVPIITNDNVFKHKPEFESVIDGETGFVFKDGDSVSLAAIIIKLLNLSEKEKQALKQNAFNLIKQKYTPRKQAMYISNRVKSLFNGKIK